MDADFAEALWALDQPPGHLNMAIMVRDTQASLVALPAARRYSSDTWLTLRTEDILYGPVEFTKDLVDTLREVATGAARRRGLQQRRCVTAPRGCAAPRNALDVQLSPPETPRVALRAAR